MVALVTENPALDAEELVKLATEAGLDVNDVHQLLEDAEAAGNIIERGGKYWVVQKGEFAFGEYDH